ncbi:hypothetical protein [Sphingomonas sp. PAMC 26621]|uniref:hypothetical protein n=1 Tax=Sphingomonas sp. PAMC 26621 TaxID=1112213 RepID=UPI001478F98D|nr:hypothetical protein [Sphingomonas sp. PAMC 26621]
MNRSSLYVDAGRGYLPGMATILSVREQTETGALARRVGGYANMLRLEAELKALEDHGQRGRIARDGSTGQLRVVAA